MRRTMIGQGISATVAIGLLMAAVSAQDRPGGASEKMYRVAGVQRDGTSVFPRVAYAQMKPLKEGEVDFQHFHSYEEATMLLRKWAAAYPISWSCIRLAGHSAAASSADHVDQQEDRHALGQGGVLLEGDGTPARLRSSKRRFLVCHLLENYGKDTAITRLVDTKAITRAAQQPGRRSLYH